MTTIIQGADDPVLQCYRYLLNRRAERMAQQNKTGDADNSLAADAATPAGDGPQGRVNAIVDAETRGASCCRGGDV